MRVFVASAAVACAVCAAAASPASAVSWSSGYVFAGIPGAYNVYDNAGNFKETLSTGLGGGTTGCALDASGNLWGTAWDAGRVLQFAASDPHSVTKNIDVTAQGGANPESITITPSGDFYVGNTKGDKDVQKYDGSGNFLRKFDVAFENQGSDWIDLAADLKTLYHTSEGRKIFRYDLSTGTQLGDFATLPGATDQAFAVRVLPDGSGGVLVADTSDIKRLDASGNIVQTYDVPGNTQWFALSLDPSGTSLWAGDTFGANDRFYRFNLATGAVEVGPIAAGGDLAGLCVKGERTAALNPPPKPQPPTNPPCGNRAISLYRADAHGKSVDLTGEVAAGLANRPVSILANYGKAVAGRLRTIATVTPATHGQFTARVKRPPKRLFIKARFQAQVDRFRSARLKLPQSLSTRSIKFDGNDLVLSGRIKRSVLGRRNPVVIKRLLCGRYLTVATVKPDKRGNYTVRIQPPASVKGAFYRAEAFVLPRKGSKRYVKQYARAEASPL